MSLLTLFNLLGKTGKELTKPRENVGRQILSDAFHGSKVVPKTIGEIEKTNTFSQGAQSLAGWTTIIDEFIEVKGNSTEMILTHAVLDFLDIGADVIWNFIVLEFEVSVDSVPFPAYKINRLVNPSLGITTGQANLTGLEHIYIEKGDTGFDLKIRVRCVSGNPSIDRSVSVVGKYYIIEGKR